MAQRVARCPAELTLKVIGGRWKVLLLYHLFQGTRRFSQLRRSINGITQKMLTQQLREMERDGLVHREVFPSVPPRVEYSLTDLGMSLKPVIDAMCDWGIRYREGGLSGGALELVVADLARKQAGPRLAQSK
jgi:DNA-binding HxlR family transcriptional regulator